MPVAVVLAVLASLVRPGADHRRRLGFYQGLQGSFDALADDIDVASGAKRVKQFVRIKILLGHRCDLLVVSFQGYVEIHSGGPLRGGPSARFTPIHGTSPSAFYQQVTCLLGCPSLPQPGASVAALCCSLPEAEEWADVWGLPQPLKVESVSGLADDIGESPVVQAWISPIPDEMIPPGQVANPQSPEELPSLNAVHDLLRPYPSLSGQNAPDGVLEARRYVPGLQHIPCSRLSWIIDEPLSYPDRQKWRMRLMSYLETYEGDWAGNGWAVPAVGGNSSPLHPLATWWAILYGMSMLAQYHPRIWRELLDLDRNREAVAIHSVLDAAKQEVPYLLLRQLSSPKRPRG